MQPLRLIILGLALWPLASFSQASIGARYARFHAVEEASFGALTLKRARLVSAAYENEFGTLPPLRRVDDGDLRLLFRAATSAQFYALDDRYTDAMLRLFNELERRRLGAPADGRDVFEALVASRRLVAASEFAARHPAASFESIPQVHDAVTKEAEPTVWRLDGENRLERVGVDFATTRIIVVAHPSCHFTQHAVRDIEGDRDLATLFEQHALWVAPQRGRFDLDLFRDWNELHAGMPMTIAYKRSEWPGINGWETPTFYFLRQGRVVKVVTGWPDTGRRNELVEAMHAIGLQ